MDLERYESLYRERGSASLYIMATRTDPNAPLKDGTTQFLIPAGTPVFTIGRTHNKIGWRFYQNAELIFDNCCIPDANRLLGVNEGEGRRRERISGFNDIEFSEIFSELPRQPLNTLSNMRETVFRAARSSLSTKQLLSS